jgi:3-hydroxyacyl-CoA dehydrogenase
MNDSAESRARAALELAERRAGRLPPGAQLAVQRVAVIGAGTMGAGIAIACLDAGLAVSLIDLDPACLERGLARVRATIEGLVHKGRRSPAHAQASLTRLACATTLGAARESELCIEAVFENMSVKREVFAALDAILLPAALLASNTSYLSIGELARATKRPAQVLGLHFFSPAHVMRLVEVVRAAASSADTLRSGVAFARRLGKIAVIAADSVGFIGNRMLQAYGRESQLLLLEGASPAEVDAALEAFGFAMGPCAVFDLAGLDVGYRARRERTDLPHDPRYFRVCDLLVEAGRLGQKARAGHYRYGDDARKRIADPEVDTLIATESAALGITRRAIDANEIVTRCVYALINEGARLLESSVAQRPSDIDVVWTNGYGFPRERGGPMYYADAQGLAAVVTALRLLEAERGAEFTPAPLLLRLAAEGRDFASLNADPVSGSSGAPP